MTTIQIIKTTLLAFVALFGMQTIKAAERFVNFNQGDLLLNPQKQVTITTDEADFKAVDIAVHALAADFGRVTGQDAVLQHQADAKIIVGTIGHSKFIEQLAKKKLIDATQLKGKREKFIITTV